MDFKKMFSDLGVIMTDDHFVYSKGEHGSSYINKYALYPHTRQFAMCAGSLAAHACLHRLDVEVVIGPLKAGAVVAHHAAAKFDELMLNDCKAVFAERVDGKLQILNGFGEFIAGRNVFVVDDVIRTGGEVREVIEAVRALKGGVVGVGVIANRGGITAADLDVPDFFTLYEVNMEAWSEDDCPLCKADIPVNEDVGHGKAFMDRKRAER